MARNRPSIATPLSANVESAEEESPSTAPLMGGTMGIAEHPDRKVSVGGPNIVGNAGAVEVPGRPEAVEPQRFRVAAERHITYDSCRTILRAGKVLTEQTHNLELLRSQGVVLEPCD